MLHLNEEQLKAIDEFKEKLGIGTDSAKEENINVEDILDKVKGILGG